MSVYYTIFVDVLIFSFLFIRSKKMMQERPDHQLAVIGSLVPAIPWIIRNAHRSEKECAQNTVDFIKLTHPVPLLIPYVECYSRLLHSVINGRDLKSEVRKYFFAFYCWIHLWWTQEVVTLFKWTFPHLMLTVKYTVEWLNSLLSDTKHHHF